MKSLILVMVAALAGFLGYGIGYTRNINEFKDLTHALTIYSEEYNTLRDNLHDPVWLVDQLKWDTDCELQIEFAHGQDGLDTAVATVRIPAGIIPRKTLDHWLYHESHSPRSTVHRP